MAPEQRFTFDEIPELYDRSRPRYPAALFDDLITLAALPPTGRILEIGCGTGQATASLVQRGYSMLCLEPGAAMLRVAKKNLDRFPNVDFAHSTFEAWPLESGSFDLVVSAQAFHWVDPEVRFTKTAAALKPAGALAVFGNSVADSPSPAHDEIAAVYAQHAPAVIGTSATRWYGDEGPVRELFDASGRFGSVTWRHYPWSQAYTPAEYCDLLRSHSDHQMLPPEQLMTLLDAIAQVISAHGSAIEVAYEAHLYLAQPGS